MPDLSREESEPILTTTDSQQLHINSLILSAAGISHTVHQRDALRWSITVSQENQTLAFAEIAAYQEENQNWPLQPPKEDTFNPSFRANSVLIVISLVLLYSVTGDWSSHSLWFTAGAADSSAILEHHQYYRLITALTLHADLVHLLGNCFLGGFLLHFYFHILGNGIGLLCLLLSSAFANMLNAIGHGPGHLSVGFSTAVFAAIGILSALNFRQYRFNQPARLLLPLMAGAALLAMLGSSGERTDLGAHFFGLFTGLSAGTILGIRHIFKLRNNSWLQAFLTVTSLTLPIFCWYLAIH
jgi:membrane associated rhomboid family serine protease